MESLSVRVRNPFALRESLQIALEVSWPDLDPDRVGSLRTFVSVIPALIQPTALEVAPGVREGLLSAVAYFRRSRTYHWLREDLCQALRDLEQGLKQE